MIRFKGSNSIAALLLLLVMQSGTLYGAEAGAGRALPGDITLHVSPAAGIIYGVAGEYVYSGGRKISELKWDMKPLYCFQITGVLGIAKRFFLSLRYRYGGVGRSGLVTDYDWDLPVTGSHTFSSHDAVSLLYHEGEVSFAASFFTGRRFKVRGGLSYLMMALQVEARNGEVFVDDIQTDTLNGPVMRYFQGYQVFPFHVNGRFSPIASLEISVFAAYTPFLFCSATDMHFLKDIQYDDRISWGHFFQGSLGVIWHISKLVDFFLNTEIRWVPPEAGDSRLMTLSTGNKTGWSNNTAGISLFQVSVFFGVTLTCGR